MADDKTTPCVICGGAEWIPTTDLSSKKCVCLQRKFIREYLGSEIATAKLTPSPLYTPPTKPDEAPIDRTEENLFIKAYWADLLGHLKWALGYKYNLDERHRFRIVTDERILQVRLGAESYGSRAKSKRDDMETYNSLHDFMGEAFDLVIIRLGFLGYVNKSMPGYLKEALGIREAAAKPTWIVESPKYFFGAGHLSHSDELEAYIKENFDVIDIEPSKGVTEEVPARTLRTAPEASEDGAAMGLSPSVTVPTSVTLMPFEAEPEEAIKKRWDKERRSYRPGKKDKKSSGGGAGGIF